MKIFKAFNAVTFTKARIPYAAFVSARMQGIGVNFEFNAKDKLGLAMTDKGHFGNFTIAKQIAEHNDNTELLPENYEEWVEFASSCLSTSDLKMVDLYCQKLNWYLQDRSFLVSNRLSLADLAVFEMLKSNRMCNQYLNRFYQHVPHLNRYQHFIASIDVVSECVKILDQVIKKKVSSDEVMVLTMSKGYKANLKIENARYGAVVTRFPPEASGYLHIGHCKALCINRFLADQWGGKMIFRFDDTNPAKESHEYENAITEDVRDLLGLKYEIFSHTSDHFQLMVDIADMMIRKGRAFVDDTPKEEFSRLKQEGIPSACRDASVEQNLKLFEEMKKGSEKGMTCVLRAKFDMESKQKTMWDPVMFRPIDMPHPRTGDKFKIYPTYDYACPIVDSVEGVTHTLRTNEYHDRNEQYYAFLDAMELEHRPILNEYSRTNFTHTVMSKRKLQKLVSSGLVEGWDDPRFPTLRGLFRHGLTKKALFDFMVTQSGSISGATLSWDALWSVNKSEVDKIAPRYTAVRDDDRCRMTIEGAKRTTKVVPLHPKDPAIGNKTVIYDSEIYISTEDAKLFQDNEEITLRNWGNVIIQKIERDENNVPVHVHVTLNPQGKPKDTKWKITWLVADDAQLSAVHCAEYGLLFDEAEPRIDKEGGITGAISKTSKTTYTAVASPAVKGLSKGDIIQFERVGYFIVDKEAAGTSPIELIRIPEPGADKRKISA